jgi:porin
VVASFDLFLKASLLRGTVHLYVEGNTTPFHDGVSRRIPEANTDAGTALNRSGEGRIQVSELRLIWPIFQGSHVHLGLLDATGFLDVSQIANDENLFFLGGPFVNNPTIEFPDYALGAGLDGGLTDNGKLCYAVILTSSNGLADNPDVSSPVWISSIRLSAEF